MKKITHLVSSLLITGCMTSVMAQDIGVISIQQPSGDGCDINSQPVSVTVRNFDAATLTGSFDVTYQLDSDPVVTQTDLNLLGFAGGATRNFSFVTPINMTGNYGQHTLKVYTERAGDTDNTNDTSIFVFTNYAPSNGGTLVANDTVCSTGNGDTLFVSGIVGNVLEWQFNNGGGWIPVATTDTFFIYNNLTQTTSYRVIVQNGTCPQAMSNEITIQVDNPAVAGTLASSKTVCLGDPGDTLQLSGYYGSILKWQFNNGGGWMDIANTDDTLIYSAPTITTSYRVILDTGVCGPDTSNTVTVTVVPSSVGGNIVTDDTVCATANGDTLFLTNSFGDVQQWEFSDDGFSWIPFVTTDTFLIYNNLTQTRQYRVLIQNGSCPAVYSDTATITVTQPANAGTLASNRTVCSGASGDTLRLTGYYGSIIKWQSNNGGGWMDIANTTDTLSYPTPTATISYRVIVDTGVCGADTSNVVTVALAPATDGGNLIGSDTVCAGLNYDTIFLTNQVGNVLEWQISDDLGVSWSSLVNTDTFQVYSNLSTTRWYRALVEATGCSQEYSDTAVITTVAQPIGGTVQEDKSICGGTNTDTLYLIGYSGNVIKWQMNSGSGWMDIANTSDTLFISNLVSTTSYRAIVGNGYCPNDTATQATLTVIATTLGGSIVQSDSVCLGINRDTLQLVGHVGDIRWWERSTDDGASWTPIANTDTFQIYNNLTQTTWYRVLVEGTSCPNDYSDTAIITTYVPMVNITPQDTTTFCEGDSVQLDATTGYTAYSWNTGETTPSVVAKTTNTYTVTITDFRGCMNSDSVDVTVNPLPTADAGDDVEIDLGESTMLMGQGGTSYLWSPGETLDDVNAQNPMAKPLETTTYYLIVTDNNGCQDDDSVTVTVKKEFVFGTKNIITPNGDGFNDVWKVDNLDAYPECTVLIMNRYGTVIYQTKGYQNTWDGTVDGKTVPDGTYYYVITCDGFDGDYKGSITVLSK